jgi:hypothetical protein
LVAKDKEAGMSQALSELDRYRLRIKELESEVARLKAQVLSGARRSLGDGELSQALDQARRRQSEVEALLAGARALLVHQGFEQAARGLFDACKEITGATAGYVALLADTGEENEVLFLDPGGERCTVDPSLPMPIRGLRSEAYHHCVAVYHNDFAHSQWQDFLPAGHVRLHNVLFAPLVIEGKAVGLIGLANKPGGFGPRDQELATTFGELASVALRERRAEEQRMQLLEELKEAMSHIKRLSGIVPICASCKKVRDDAGYWQQVDTFLREHSDLMLSHSICPSCRQRLYPDV